jgi:hypothetical protein
MVGLVGYFPPTEAAECRTTDVLKGGVVDSLGVVMAAVTVVDPSCGKISTHLLVFRLLCGAGHSRLLSYR